MDNWTWPFETEGPTLTSVIGKTKQGFRQPNEWVGDLSIVPKYPVYVISKGRWKMRKTSKVLERMCVPYKIVIEAQEYDQYAAVIDPAKILVLPEKFREKYRGESSESGGSIPARNFCWEHSLLSKAQRHWLLDDNLHCFQRLHRREKQHLWTGAGFKATEDFVDRYSNVALAGPQYISFCDVKSVCRPYSLNTRIYSCILINNKLPFRWRGMYNEDTDLSLRALKTQWCTVLSYAFLVDKTTTMRHAGGNTEELYNGDGVQATRNTNTEGRRKMAESLAKQHPDVAKVVTRYGRPHHAVDYKPFKENKLRRCPGATNTISHYGLRQVEDVLYEAANSI